MSSSLHRLVRSFFLTFLALAGQAPAAERAHGEGPREACRESSRGGDDPASGFRCMDRERMRQLRQDLRRNMENVSQEPGPYPDRFDEEARGGRRGLHRLSPEERERMRYEMRGVWRGRGEE